MKMPHDTSFSGRAPNHSLLPTCGTQTLPLKACVGHSDRVHLSSEPSPGRSSGPLWLNPTYGYHLGWSVPDLPENPQTHPDSTMAGSPRGPLRHEQMACTQSNKQWAGLARYPPSEPPIPLGWSASVNCLHHDLIYELWASLFGSDTYFGNVKMLRKVWR